ncbi:hypothetical protein CSB11_00615 [Candidatus Campbellbacteria bacterium]|nr:MAG: hypothetical protein CSB11_00615 [Candidatus Campbellbacteria bacterium]
MKSSNDLKIKKDDFEKIIFIAGINHTSKRSAVWKKVLKEKFPNKELVFLDDVFYVYIEKNKIESIIKRALEELKDNKKTIIIAHSYGGILAKKIIQENSKQKRDNVVSLITLVSPHSYDLFGLKQVKKDLGVSKNIKNKKIKIFTFGGYFDMVVPFSKTSLRNSIHKNLKTYHMAFLLSKKIVNKVLEIFE